MANKYTMKQRVAYQQGVAKAGGLKGARARGYLQGVKDQQTATRIARAKNANRCPNCGSGKGGKKK